MHAIHIFNCSINLTKYFRNTQLALLSSADFATFHRISKLFHIHHLMPQNPLLFERLADPTFYYWVCEYSIALFVINYLLDDAFMRLLDAFCVPFVIICANARMVLSRSMLSRFKTRVIENMTQINPISKT